MSVCFFTVQKTISANYHTDCDTLQQDVPQHGIFEISLQKAKRLIDEAENNGILVYERFLHKLIVCNIFREVTEEEFRDKIVNGHVAIVLVNSLFIACLECKSNLYDGFHLTSIPCFGDPYRGLW